MTRESVSVIIPVSRRADSLADIVGMIHGALEELDHPYSILLSVDGDLPERLEEARALAKVDDRLKLIALARNFGEGGALRTGLHETDGEIVLTHPSYFQVEPDVIPKLIEAVGDGAGLAFASRRPGRESWFTRFQRWAFNALMRRGMWVDFSDAACGVRAARRETLLELAHTDSFHRFLPVQAAFRGIDVREIPATVHQRSPRTRIYSPGVYLRRFLDILNVFFLTRFLYKPLRFFGLIGVTILSVGLLICLYLSILKLGFDEGIGDRPALLLGVLMVAVGFQLVALGLLGELIAFAHAGTSPPYRIREVVRNVASDNVEAVSESARPADAM